MVLTFASPRDANMTVDREAYDVPDVPPLDEVAMSDSLQRFNRLGEELRAIVDGPVFVRPSSITSAEQRINNARQSDTDKELAARLAAATPFEESTTIFNSAALMAAWIVVRPRNTASVSAVMAFCQRNNLSPSIRSGGFSTAGWSIHGQVVLDMRDLDQIRMFPPSVKHASQISSLMSAGSQNMSKSRSVDRGSDIGSISAKRYKTDSVLPEEASNSLQSSKSVSRTSSHGSGAEADAESSSGQGSSSSGGDLVTSNNGSADSIENRSVRDDSDESEGPTFSANRSPCSGQYGGSSLAETVPSAVQRSAAAREWAERLGSDEQSSPSTGSGSLSRSVRDNSTPSGSSAAPTTPAPDTEMGENKLDGHDEAVLPQRKGTGQDPLQRRQQLQPSSSSRMVLPTTGGFVWTAGDGADQPASARPLNADDPVYLGGSTLPELQAAQSGSSSHPYGIFSAASASATGTKTCDAKLSTSEDFLPPGIHKEKARLVEFGPGVGVRELDIHTSGTESYDQSAFSGAPKKSIGKGKGRDDSDVPDVISDIHMNTSGLDFKQGSVPYHVPLSAYPVGSAAMTTGGFGYLSRAYGLSIDNIVELDLVLADGRIKTLNDTSAKSPDQEERELWWAARGAAPCFGVVTRMVAKAYPVPKVYSGNLIYPFNQATAPSLMRHWRDCLKGTAEQIPRELYSNLILTAGPADEYREHVIVIQVCYLGTSSSEEVGANFVQAISSWTGERMLLKDVAEKSFLSQQDGVAQVLKSGHGRRWVVRGDLLTTMTDEVIARTIKQFIRMGNRAVWLFELIGGAIEDAGHTGETCVGLEQRQAKFTAAALQQWADVEEDAHCVHGVDEWVNDVLSTVSVGGPFANFLERNESRKRCEGSFGADNLRRLIQLKRRVDPSGIITHTFGRGLQQFVEEDDAAST